MMLPYQRCLIKYVEEEKGYTIILDDDAYKTDVIDDGIIVRRDKLDTFETLDAAIEYAEKELHFSKKEIFIQLFVY